MSFSKVPVLTYHSVNIVENSYRANDHIALASDLSTLTRLGWRIVSIREVVSWHQFSNVESGSEKAVAISCDDGSWFDYYDLEHPTCGMQRSFLNILRDFKAQWGAYIKSPPHITTFVISSPDARDELDKKGLIGKRWWGDEWWSDAEASGMMEIGCHSWDHVHPDLERVVQRNQVKGDFSLINSFQDCEIQVRRAGDYIAAQLEGRRPILYAYPWGEASEYIQTTYLPNYRDRHGFEAAFSTEPKPLEKSDSIWSLPRFVFGRDWTSPEGLESLLKECS